MNKQWLIIPVAGLVLLTGGYLYQKENKNNALLKVGCESAFPPFEMLDESGVLTGFDCNVIKEVAHRMGKEVEYSIMPFESLVIALQQKKVDVIISALSITKARKKILTLIPYFKHQPKNGHEWFPLVFWDTIPDGITKIEDLAKMHPLIGVQTASVQKDLIESYPFLHIRQLATIPDLLMDIKYGKSLACMLEPAILASIREKYPQIVVLKVPLPEWFNNEGYGIGIAPENKSLALDVQKAISTMHADGTLNMLEKKWLSHISPSF